MALKDIMSRLFGRGGTSAPELPTQAVEFDGIDRMVFDDVRLSSPRFQRVALDSAPIITPDAREPEPLDFTSASPDEVKAWQEAVRAARAARDQADPYGGWEKLVRDVFYYFHHARPPKLLEPDAMDPGFADHAKIMQVWAAQPESADARNDTKDDEQITAWTVMAGIGKLKELAGPILEERFRKSHELQQQMDEAREAMEELESLRDRAKDLREQGMPIPQNLKNAVKDAVRDKRQAQQAAAELAQHMPPPMTTDLYEAIKESTKAAKEASGMDIPSFGQGFGRGEPVYESPEQALAIAEAWSTGVLAEIAQTYGRMQPEFQFERAKRIVGGQDEIVDVEMGDELRRVTPGELVLLGDEDTEDDFYTRYASKELLVYSTVGEEHAGRGAIGMVLDGSYSMKNLRNTWARAVFLTLLNVARREKRDCFLVEFSDVSSVISHEFPAKQPLDAQTILDAASHFFGGGTAPLAGIQRAVDIMKDQPVFKSADLVVVSDGEAAFGPEDERLKAWLNEKGVRIHGIGIGSTFGYLKRMCNPDTLVSVHDMELSDPNAATSMLAVSIT